MPTLLRIMRLLPNVALVIAASACVPAVDYSVENNRNPYSGQQSAAEQSISPEIEAQLRDRDAVDAYRKYLAASEHKAFASSGTAWGWVFNRASKAIAAEDALAECRKYLGANHPPCEIISVDGLESSTAR